MVILCWMELMEGVILLPWPKTLENNWKCFDQRQQCVQAKAVGLEEEEEEETVHTKYSNMVVASSCWKISPIISIFVFFLFFSSSSVSPVMSSKTNDFHQSNQTFRPGEELQKLKMIRAHLKKINKPSVKTIQSPDGDLIDCVVAHQQPAFDHPQLKGQKPLDPPERPKGHNPLRRVSSENYQLWSMSGETCPEGSVPIRRTNEQDLLRASSITRFGRKISKPIRRDTSNDGHEHAVGYVTGEEYYGAKASINVWAPQVASQYEFSLSQMWLISGSFGDDLNTIEAGWQACMFIYNP